MAIEVQHLRGSAGLEILVGEPCGADLSPTAMIHIEPECQNDLSLETPCRIIARISPDALRAMVPSSFAFDNVLSHSDSGGRVHIEIRNAAVVRRIITEIYGSRHRDASQSLFLQAKFFELLIEGLSTPAPGAQIGKDRGVALAVYEALLADPLNPPTMEYLSHLTGAPPRRMNDAFRAEFGKTPIQWLTEWRLTHARDLLMRGDLPIAQIAHVVGYAHLHTFTSAFTRHFGMPPGRMRSKNAMVDIPLPKTRQH